MDKYVSDGKIKNEYITIGSYFQNGGETFTHKELLYKILNDLGLDEKDGSELIKECVNQGFIIDCGNNCYTR